MSCRTCDKKLGSDRCTNRRCGACHRSLCTPGGNTSPGHGVGTREAEEARRKELK